MNSMTKYILAVGMLSAAVPASASSPRYNPADIKIEGLEVIKDGSRVLVNCDIDASALKLKSNQDVTITPLLTSRSDSLFLSPLTIAGRNRYIFHERRNDLSPDSRGMYHNGKDASSIRYAASAAYDGWMNDSGLSFILDWAGCCNAPEMSERMDYAGLDMGETSVNDLLVFVEPEGSGAKTRHVDGRAFIDFPVNKTVINADYRNNAVELAKIVRTIDNVRSDEDVTITSITIKGFASPEGPYANNERLAKGRTEALTEYVHDLYKFPETVRFSSEWEAEDWDGLRSYLEKSEVHGKSGIIDIIDSDLLPDEKEAKIRSTYPEEYSRLLTNVFPGLRHSDYVIEYTVKEYTDAEEIIDVMRKDPSKLSLSEFYFAAQSAEPGSELFNEIFETAARLHPTDEMANLNAANASLSRGDAVAASKYLEKAGSSDEAIYAGAIVSVMNDDFESARASLEKIHSYPAAKELLDRLEDLKRARQGYVKVIRR